MMMTMTVMMMMMLLMIMIYMYKLACIPSPPPTDPRGVAGSVLGDRRHVHRHLARLPRLQFDGDSVLELRGGASGGGREDEEA